MLLRQLLVHFYALCLPTRRCSDDSTPQALHVKPSHNLKALQGKQRYSFGQVQAATPCQNTVTQGHAK